MLATQQEKQMMFNRAEELLVKGLLPVDRKNILFFVKLAVISLIASSIVFTLGLVIGYLFFKK